MSLHGALQLFLRRTRRKVQLCIQRIDMKEITVFALRRTRRSISIPAKTIAPIHPGNIIFPDRLVGSNIPHKPVIKNTMSRIGIFHDKCKRLCLPGYPLDLQRRVYLLSFTGVFTGDIAAILKG